MWVFYVTHEMLAVSYRFMLWQETSPIDTAIYVVTVFDTADGGWERPLKGDR